MNNYLIASTGTKLDKEIITGLKNWFLSYVNKFTYTDSESQRNIDLKLEHTERVTREIILIGKQIGLNGNELDLAEIIALFHDIGRFEQYDKYRTFSDRKSENHAELGIKVLKKYNVLANLDKKVQGLISYSIRYHNRASLPTGKMRKYLFYLKLLRDADKLDIWKVVTDYYHRKSGDKNVTLELELPDTPGISSEVYDTLMNRKIVDMKFVRNINDIKLLQAGWIYDINFKPTLKAVRNRRYMELLRDALPKTDKISEIFNLINSFEKTF
jgi:putative nucleotidyltransferase with HDIG domain